jgi:hypothetical protein
MQRQVSAGLTTGSKDDVCTRILHRLDMMQMVMDSPAGDGICADQDYLGNLTSLLSYRQQNIFILVH